MSSRTDLRRIVHERNLALDARFRDNRLKYTQSNAKSMGYILFPLESANEVSGQ